MIEFLGRIWQFESNRAILSEGVDFNYCTLVTAAENLGAHLLGDETDLSQKRVAIVVDPGFDFVKSLLAVWISGGIAVPLHPKASPESHGYALTDSAATHLILGSPYEVSFKSLAGEMNIKTFSTSVEALKPTSFPDVATERGALILYTSGTTGSPKGVLTTHENIRAQITSLVTSWEWTSMDHILNVLPMHHVHGLINVLCCALWSGATCEFMPFDAKKVMERLGSGEVTTFMAVPTIYHKLIAAYDEFPKADQEQLTLRLESLRLMVSGSAALPISVLEKWRTISGHTLLERYGMTEIGMAISNSYRGERIPGYIGTPLPGVSVRMVDDSGEPTIGNEPGEIQVKSLSIFKEYWGMPQPTLEAFTSDGWFKTGDMAVVHDGAFKIIGRKSIDIIKSGGYKLSALEIEEVLREHDLISDCGVVGIPDEEWGEVVAAGLIVQEGEGEIIDFNELRKWLSKQLAPYKIPRIWKILDDLPRNAMGKVVKAELKDILSKQA